jgi:hypothetical protein
MNVFDQDFVNKTKLILKNKCNGSQVFFKKDLAKELGFNIINKKECLLGINIITAMFDLNYFPEWEIVSGKFGGITYKSSSKKDSYKSLSINFLNILFKVLVENCSHIPISRKKIADMMDLSIPDDEICNLITYSLQKKYIVGFRGRPGKGGGIVRMPSIEPKLTVESLPQASTAVGGSSAVTPIQERQEGVLWSSMTRPLPQPLVTVL